MEYPYIAVLWNPGSALQTHQVAPLVTRIQSDTRWRPVLLRNGITVFTRRPNAAFLNAYPLAGKTGVILGLLFRRDNGSRLSLRQITDDVDFAEACLRSRGEHLTKNFWGAYVALLSNQNTGDWSIARDCSGMIPCYYTSVLGITIAFSDVRDLQFLSNTQHNDKSFFRFEVNWRYIVGFLAASQMQIRDTGLKDIYELLAGESLESVSGRRVARTLWDPVSIAESNPSMGIDPGNICCVLRESAHSCITAWSNTSDRILLSLSGGFDSSLVLALLAAAPRPPNVLCVNRFASGPGEDERGYARTAARWAQADLLELPWDTETLVFNDNCLRLPQTAKPALPHLFNGLDAPIYNRLGAIHGFDTIWTGQGGDHLFMAMNTDLGLADCLKRHGLASSQMLTTLMETAKLTRKSVIHLTRLTIGRAIRFPDNRVLSCNAFFKWTNLLPQTQFLREHLLPPDLAEYIQHPWAARSAVLPPGKRYQLLLLAEVLNRHRPLYGLQDLQEFHPLLSQPLIEDCLRIPVYLLFTGGKTRGLARLAFADCMPPQIVTRHGKGQTTQIALSLFRRSLPFLRQLLLDGSLVQRDLVDRNALESVLNPGGPIDGTTLFPLAACLAIEVWLQGWMSKTADIRHAGSRPVSTTH